MAKRIGFKYQALKKLEKKLGLSPNELNLSKAYGDAIRRTQVQARKGLKAFEKKLRTIEKSKWGPGDELTSALKKIAKGVAKLDRMTDPIHVIKEYKKFLRR